MADIIAYARYIEDLITAIKTRYTELPELGVAKAQTAMEYEKALAIAIVGLKGEHPVSILEKIAKGECVKQLYDKMVAESAYKACITKIEANKAQLNAYQSLFRHLDTAQR